MPRLVGFKGKLYSLQALRALAATMVVTVHAVNSLDRITDTEPGHYSAIGSSGVDVFFLISGAIIWITAFERKQRVGDFARRRLERIAPLYFLVTLICLPFPLLRDGAINPQRLATSFLFWPAWPEMWSPMLGVGWTLCFEMLFYFGAGLALWSRTAGAALVLLVFPTALLIARHSHWGPAEFIGNPIILEFMAGLLIAAIWPKGASLPLWSAAVLAMVSVVGLVVFCLPPRAAELVYTMKGSVSLLRAAGWGIPSAILLVAALSVEPHLRRHPWMSGPVFVGDASYAIYLTHWPLIAAVSPALAAVLAPAGLLSLLPVVLVLVAIVFGSAVHVWVERPIADLFQRGRRPAAQPDEWRKR